MSKDISISKKSRSEKETIEIANRFARRLKSGDVVFLYGQLGSGKSVFVRGALTGLGYRKGTVRSPSFTLMREYTVNGLAIYHIDLYRLDTPQELMQMGYREYFYNPDGIVFVEWADKVEGMDVDAFHVKIDYVDLTTRSITIKSNHLS